MSDELKAGRELDAVVATEIIGEWGVLWEGSRLIIQDPDGLPVINCPKYSTDIAAAWEVVEKMKADGWRWHMGGQYSGSQRPWCGFRQTAEDMDYIVSGDTAPEAICLAALKAVGYDHEEP